MRLLANSLVTTSLVVLTALATMPAQAANVEATSSVDAVTVYPDGASVTRVIAVDLPAGDNTLVVHDFPLGLDVSSLRVEGGADSQLTIGAIDAGGLPMVGPGCGQAIQVSGLKLAHEHVFVDAPLEIVCRL